MSSETIKSATAADEAAVLGVITMAFSTDPVARWIYPNPREYLAHFPSFVLAIGAKAFASGSAHYAEGFAGATLWLPPGVSPDEERPVAMIRETVAERLQGDLFKILEQVGAAHPEEPHWYLWAIGTDPTRQSRGYGSALLRHALASCDRDKKLAYLESSNPRNLSLYLRHGFELIGTIQAGSSPPVFPMLRKPR
jgi:ribosomal protein S18 acetylase RimI-like enzyme